MPSRKKLSVRLPQIPLCFLSFWTERKEEGKERRLAFSSERERERVERILAPCDIYLRLGSSQGSTPCRSSIKRDEIEKNKKQQ